MHLTKRVTGVVGRLHDDPLQYCILAACTAIAWAYCLELTVLAFYTFRRRSGLYFYSLLISSWGCTLHALGFVLKFMTTTPSGGFLPFIEIGWVAMVTGQSFVLYSRLHLVVRKRRTLHLVLGMIITDAIILHTPTIVLTIGSNGPNGHHFAPIFNVMERIQLAMFCIQEFIISTIYIVCTVRLLRSIYHSKTRGVMWELIIINAVCLSMDVVLIGLEYSNNYVGETSAKGMIYAIKLKLEFAVLNQLMSLTSAGLTEHQNYRPQAFEHHGSTSSGLGGGSGAGRGGGGHEMRNRSIITEVDTETNPPPKLATWKSRRVWNGSFSKNDGRGRVVGDANQIGRESWRKRHLPPMSPGKRIQPRHDQIARTQQIEVVSEPKGLGSPARKEWWEDEEEDGGVRETVGLGFVEGVGENHIIHQAKNPFAKQAGERRNATRPKLGRGERRRSAGLVEEGEQWSPKHMPADSRGETGSQEQILPARGLRRKEVGE